MSKQMRKVKVCDECGTHHDVSDWPQIGGDYCDDCATRLRDRQCRGCGDFDHGSELVERRGRNVCWLCAADIDAEDAEDEAS